MRYKTNGRQNDDCRRREQCERCKFRCYRVSNFNFLAKQLFAMCGTPHRHASLQQSLRRDQICSILTAKFKSKKSHYFCLLVVVLVAVVGVVALSQDILETSLSHHAHVHENLCKLLPLQLYVLCFKDLYICMKERREKIHKIASPSQRRQVYTVMEKSLSDWPVLVLKQGVFPN